MVLRTLRRRAGRVLSGGPRWHDAKRAGVRSGHRPFLHAVPPENSGGSGHSADARDAALLTGSGVRVDEPLARRAIEQRDGLGTLVGRGLGGLGLLERGAEGRALRTITYGSGTRLPKILLGGLDIRHGTSLLESQNGRRHSGATLLRVDRQTYRPRWEMSSNGLGRVSSGKVRLWTVPRAGGSLSTVACSHVCLRSTIRMSDSGRRANPFISSPALPVDSAAAVHSHRAHAVVFHGRA